MTADQLHDSIIHTMLLVTAFEHHYWISIFQPLMLCSLTAYLLFGPSYFLS